MFNVQEFINSLPDTTNRIDVSYRQLTFLPDLSRFTNLEELVCSNNELTCLPPFNKSVKRVYCYNNRLTSLPPLNEHLQIVNCAGNRLTSLPPLNGHLYTLNCAGNQLTSLPLLPKKLQQIVCNNNPVYDILELSDNVDIIRPKISIIHSFCWLFYSLKFKPKFRYWLWEMVRRPTIEKRYHPCYLIDNVTDETNLGMFLHNW